MSQWQLGRGLLRAGAICIAYLSTSLIVSEWSPVRYSITTWIVLAWVTWIAWVSSSIAALVISWLGRRGGNP